MGWKKHVLISRPQGLLPEKKKWDSNTFPFSIICECNSSVFHLTFSKLLFAVLLGDFHLEYLVLTDGGSHLRQTLSTRAPNTNQQHVAPELTYHPHCTCYCGGKTKILPKSFLNRIRIITLCMICTTEKDFLQKMTRSSQISLHC